MTQNERPRRNIDTTNATHARRMAKWRRWADEMRQHGWTVSEPSRES